MSAKTDAERKADAKAARNLRTETTLRLLLRVVQMRREGLEWRVVYERLGVSASTVFRKNRLLEELLERVEKSSQPGGSR